MPVRNRYKVFIIDEVHQLSSAVVQRAAEVDRGAAAARRLHDGDDRARQDSRDGAVALAGLRVPDHQHEGDRRSAAHDRRRREDRGRRRVAAAHRARRRGQHARRAEQARSGDRVHRHRRSAPTTWRRCSAWSAATCCSTSCRRWPTRTRRRRSRWPAAPSRWATTCGSSAASCRASCATCWCCRSIRRASSDPEIAGEGERDRLTALAQRFSREDLLRAFDLLTRAEADIRSAAQPRYHLEMALLRWIYLRKLVPIEDLIAGCAAARPPSRALAGQVRLRRAARRRPCRRPRRHRRPRLRRCGSAGTRAFRQCRASRSLPSRTAAPPSPAPSAPAPTAVSRTRSSPRSARRRPSSTTRSSRRRRRSTSAAIASTFTFSPTQRTLREQFEQNRAWLEALAQQVAGRKMPVGVVQQRRRRRPSRPQPWRAEAATDEAGRSAGRQALADAGVQALLEVFPAEIRDVEEM